MVGVEAKLIADESAGGASIEWLSSAVRPLQQSLIRHPVYGRLRDARSLRIFCEHHVFAVWDFMCLLKTLQRRLAPHDVPWQPPPDVEAARIVNEVMVVEESDERPGGGHASHFELYLEAMREIGADTTAVERFLEGLRAGRGGRDALIAANAPAAATRFVQATLETCALGGVHEVAASFVFGRENLIPAMFRRIIGEIAENAGLRIPFFRYYLDRHVTVDGDTHGPAGERLIARLCGDDPSRWREAAQAGVEALQARVRLWNGILGRIDLGL